VIRAVKGTRDILPPSSAIWNKVEAAARRVFAAYNYQEIRTPILEETALFSRSVGEDTDIVSKEMYTFEDRDPDKSAGVYFGPVDVPVGRVLRARVFSASHEDTSSVLLIAGRPQPSRRRPQDQRADARDDRDRALRRQ